VRTTRTAKHLVLHLSAREKRLLFEILKLYPRVPPGHLHLTKLAQGKEAEANQRLLEEALAEQRQENQRNLKALLADPQRWKGDKLGFRLTLAHSEVEWLLQVLNDIRVGSWVLLGSPEQLHDFALLNEATAPHFWAMEISGLFQQQLIDTLVEGKR
jgi:hypothetical protein